MLGGEYACIESTITKQEASNPSFDIHNHIVAYSLLLSTTNLLHTMLEVIVSLFSQGDLKPASISDQPERPPNGMQNRHRAESIH